MALYCYYAISQLLLMKNLKIGIPHHRRSGRKRGHGPKKLLALNHGRDDRPGRPIDSFSVRGSKFSIGGSIPVRAFAFREGGFSLAYLNFRISNFEIKKFFNHLFQ